MSSYNRINFLVANRDYPIKPANQPIDACPSGDCKDKCKYNAVPGEILIVDLETRLTIDVAGIATVRKLGIAQASGDSGCATALKWLFHDNFNLCEHKFDVHVASPACGQQQIIDVYIPNCTKTDTTMGFGLWLDDSYVRATNGFNNKLMYNWVVDNYKSGCTDCDDTAVCDELICALVDKINGGEQPDPTKVVHGTHANMCDRYQPFRAARLYVGTNTTKNFCLTPTVNACSECAHIPAITGIDIDGTVTPFTFTTDPSNPTLTLIAQIDRVVSAMNAALRPIGGSAIRLRGISDCCDFGIQVNTCASVVRLQTSGGGFINPCSTANVAATQNAQVICRDCGSTPPPEALRCGIRFVVDAVTVPCNCAWPPDLPTPNTYIRRITDFSLLGQDVGTNELVVIPVQDTQNPEGYGYYYQDKQRRQSNGGEGKDWRYTNVPFGDLMFPDKGSRDSHTDVICNAQYCVYDFDISYSALGHHNNAVRYHQRNLGRVLIRNTNSVLIPQWEAILAALQTRQICSNINTTCTP